MRQKEPRSGAQRQYRSALTPAEQRRSRVALRPDIDGAQKSEYSSVTSWGSTRYVAARPTRYARVGLMPPGGFSRQLSDRCAVVMSAADAMAHRRDDHCFGCTESRVAKMEVRSRLYAIANS